MGGDSLECYYRYVREIECGFGYWWRERKKERKRKCKRVDKETELERWVREEREWRERERNSGMNWRFCFGVVFLGRNVGV